MPKFWRTSSCRWNTAPSRQRCSIQGWRRSSRSCWASSNAAAPYFIPSLFMAGTQHLIHQVIEPLGFTAQSVVGRRHAGAYRRHCEHRQCQARPNRDAVEPYSHHDRYRAAAAAALRGHPQRPLAGGGQYAARADVSASTRSMAPIWSFTRRPSFSAALVICSLARCWRADTGSDPAVFAALRALFGNILQADECWMLNSRLSTVALRMNRQSKNAQRIAEHLADHPRVRRVLYPSLFKDAEQIRIRDSQTDYPGSLLSLELRGKEGSVRFSPQSDYRKECRQFRGGGNSRLSSDNHDA